MPRKPLITREMILRCAFELVREKGGQALSIRAVAGRLACSTQPVLYQFSSIAELTRAVYEEADAFHTQYLFAKEAGEGNPLLALGLRYIRFAAEEGNLFRFLFQSDHFAGRSLEELTTAPEADGLLQTAGRILKMDKSEARQAFLVLFSAVHGYASLLANNAMPYEPETAKAMLRSLERAFEKGGNHNEETV